jgi:myosin-5
MADIYGFESFENRNGFEQLLINHSNEKLQNHFNRHIFQIEQQEYENESIDWSYISFNDNQPCIELIEGKPSGRSGIFQTLDDSLASGRADVNASFLAQLNQTWAYGSTHANYLAPRFNSDKRFGIAHYAGEVFYEVAGFGEKNRDNLNKDMREFMQSSKHTLLRDMAVELTRLEAMSPSKSQKLTSSSTKLKEDSISKQFTQSLRKLYSTLDATHPHYVRCIKPNEIKAPSNFMYVLVLNILSVILNDFQGT